MTKLHFKEYNKSHAEDLARIKSTKEVIKYYLNEPISAEQFDKDVIENSKRKFRSYYYTIILDEDSEKIVIGCFTYDVMDTDNRKCFVNYFIDPKYHGFGYGKTMIKLAIDLGKKFKLNKMIANVMPENKASQNILLNNGFKICGTFHKHVYYENKFHDLFIYEFLY